MSLISLAAYKTIYGITDTSNDLALTALIPMAEDWIIRYLTYNPFLSTYAEYYNGTGNNFIRLNAKPIVSISSIVINPYALNPTTITGTNFIYDQNSIVYFSPQYQQFPSVFPQGNLNILANYTAGYSLANIPQSMKLAVSLLVNRSLSQTDPNRLINSEKLGDHDINYGKGWWDLQGVQWTDVRNILNTGFTPIKFIF